MSQKVKFIFLSVLSGVLLSFGWFQWASGIITIIGFVPLLFIEQHLDKHKHQNRSVVFFLYCLLAFFVWNLINTWWIANATFFGVSAAIIYSSLIMGLTMWIFHASKRVLGPSMGYFCLVIYWLSFEHVYQVADLSWPWLNLGNAFANDVKLVQWYDITGIAGGTTWILALNLAIFQLLRKYIYFRQFRPLLSNAVFTLALLLLPMVYSITSYHTYAETENPVNVLVLQPNIDPYNEKFGGMSTQDQLDVMLNQARAGIDSATDYIITPESAVEGNIWEGNLNQNKYLAQIKNLVLKHPGVAYISGTFSYKLYEPGEEIPSTASPIGDKGQYYDKYNGVMQIDTSDVVQVYHKSKLVVGVEKMPFSRLLGFMDKLIIQLGGIRESLGVDEERVVFHHPSMDVTVGTGICYESVYGEFMSKFVRNGANILFISTNDGWWGDTPGYKQHNSYSRLRAIENRRSLARSANTGISCFINQRGDIISKTGYWEQAILKGTINANDKITFYTRHGDYLFRLAHFFSVLMVLYSIVRLLTRKNEMIG